MWLERFVLTKAENNLLHYRLLALSVKASLSENYEKYLPEIKKCYEKATYWHGTGRYHYKHQDGSRYENVDTEKLIDILDSVTNFNGLVPHFDPWIPLARKTVSLGTVRMHSRLFAVIHEPEGESLLFSLGSTKYWIRFYLFLLVYWLFSSPASALQFFKSLFRKSFNKDIQNWASSIRKPINGRVINILDMITGNVPGSDIKNNYPLIFGIDGNGIEVTDTIPLTHAVEVRSTEPIPLDRFTHIEVPLNKVEETESFLANKSINIKVLPLEFVDLYLSDLPLKTLAYV